MTRSEAARINGAKSIGRVTPEGKQRSSHNALKHGLCAGAAVLRSESPEEYEALVRSYFAELEPLAQVEPDLVHQLVFTFWRQRRMWAMQTAAIDNQMDIDAPQIEKTYDTIDCPTRTALALQHPRRRERRASGTPKIAERTRAGTATRREKKNPEQRKQKTRNEPNAGEPTIQKEQNEPERLYLVPTDLLRKDLHSDDR